MSRWLCHKPVKVHRNQANNEITYTKGSIILGITVQDPTKKPLFMKLFG